jgi:hypothetical protein
MTDRDTMRVLMRLSNVLRKLAEAWPSLLPRERALVLMGVGETVRDLEEDQEKRAGKA